MATDDDDDDDDDDDCDDEENNDGDGNTQFAAASFHIWCSRSSIAVHDLDLGGKRRATQQPWAHTSCRRSLIAALAVAQRLSASWLIATRVLVMAAT